MAGSVAQTCNRLSQFLKKGGSFGDINLFEAAKITTTTTTTTNLFPAAAEISSRWPKPTDPETAQMTIFYAGQVIVLDGFPSDKAMEIMDAARSASSSRSTGFLGGGGAFSAVDEMIISTNTNFGAASDCNQVRETQLQLQPEAVTGSSSDLPIARRASFRRFLIKRKDRVATRAPYQLNKPAGEESHSWIDLEEQPSEHLELKL